MTSTLTTARPTPAQTVSFGTQRREVSPSEEADNWSAAFSRRYAVFLIVGFACPLLWPSFLFGGAELLWPWDLLKAPGLAAKTWVILPLAASVSILALRKRLDSRPRSVVCFAAGLATFLGLLLLDAGGAADVVGLPMGVPPEARLIVLGAVAAVTSVAVGNRLRKTFQFSRLARTLGALGGGGIVAAFLVPFQNRPLLFELCSVRAWSSEFLFSLAAAAVLAYAVLGLANALRRWHHEGLSLAVSVLARLWVVLLPLALLVAAAGGPAGPSGFEDSGLSAAVVVWTLKFTALYYGALLLMASGLAAFLISWLWDRIIDSDHPPGPARVTCETPPSSTSTSTSTSTSAS
jgi:hypothetical protein